MNASLKKIKVLIVDDQKIVRETLKLYLTAQNNLEVVDCAANGVIALEKIEKLNPNVVIIDLEMPGMSGITTIEIISDRFPEVKSLVLSTHEEKEYINQAVSAGARGYFLKGTPIKDLVIALEKVHQGYFQLGVGLLDKLNFDSYQKTILKEESKIPLATSQCNYYSKVTEQENSWIQTKTTTDNLEREIKNIASSSVNNKTDDFSKIRRELVDIIEFKFHIVEAKRAKIQLKYQKLQHQFSWLLASQLLLLSLFLGCTSFLLDIQNKVVENQENIKLTNTFQSVK